jgi:serine/threonine protein kinase
MAQMLKFGDFAPGMGGEFERQSMKALRESLPDYFLVIGNLSVPRGDGSFYEIDVLVVAPTVCNILELKCFRDEATVYEDRIVGFAGYSLDRVFSILDSKSKVLSGRLRKRPFPYESDGGNLPWINSFVVVPDEVHINFKYEDYKKSRNVKTLAETIRYYKNLQLGLTGEEVRNRFSQLLASWRKYQTEWTSAGNRTNRSLGRFKIKRAISLSEYLAVDEPPCKVDVCLREFPYDSLMHPQELTKHISDMTREMQILRTIRHQYISCVIGHFQTGSSLVEVSDWFESTSLENLWHVLNDISLVDKIGLMLKIAQGLSFCHSKGVFHRNICARNVLVTDDLDDIRIKGFDYAKNLEFTNTVYTNELQLRDRLIIPPEELLERRPLHYRLYDIFQTGILFYRILENGAWPYEDGLDFYTGGGKIGKWGCSSNEPEIENTRHLIRQMLAIEPAHRVDPMDQIEAEIKSILGNRL